jgi:hypothetical protein
LFSSRQENEKLSIFGERSLRRAVSEYVEHFHAERNHQGKGDILPFPRDTTLREGGTAFLLDLQGHRSSTGSPKSHPQIDRSGKHIFARPDEP